MSRNGYARLSNEFWRNTKVRKLKRKYGMGAVGLFALIVTFCSDTLSDGYVSEDALLYQLDANEIDIRALCDMGMILPEGDGYRVHDYLKHQNSRESVERKAESNRERQRLWRERHGSDATGEERNALVTRYGGVSNALPFNQEPRTNNQSLTEGGSGGELSNRARVREAAPTPAGEDVDEDALVESWHPSAENIALAERLDVDARCLEQRFRDKIARKGLSALGVKRRTLAALDATFRSWIEHEAQWAGEKPKPVTQPDRPDVTPTRLSWCSPQVRELMAPYRGRFPPDVKGLGPSREWYEACKNVADRLNKGEPVETVKNDLTAQYDTQNAKTSPRIDEQDMT